MSSNGEIDFSHVTKSFKVPLMREGWAGAISNVFHKKYETRTAVNDISFHVSPGEIVGYMGPNGAGKTTTIKLLSGILCPNQGSITVNGLDPFKDRQRNAQLIGIMMGSQTRLFWNLPVRDTFSLLKEIYCIDSPAFKKRLDCLIDVLDLTALLPLQTRSLSLGQRIRCELAATFLHSPPIVFLDEPTIGLDVSVKSNIRDLLQKMNQEEKTTVILTSHDVQDIEKLAHRIVVIDQGRIIFDGNQPLFRQKFSNHTKEIAISFMRQVSEQELQGLLEDHAGEIVGCDGFQARIRIKDGISYPDFIGSVDRLSPIQDIRIEEESITEIVKRIYERHETA